MTRIRFLLQAFRARRVRQLSRESVSFEAFCNETPQRKSPTTKESSMNADFRNISLTNDSPRDEYARFSNELLEAPNRARPSPLAVLLVVALLAVFLVLPLVYLLHCFGVIYAQERLDASPEKVQLHTYSNNVRRRALEPPPAPDYGQCKLVAVNARLDCFPDDRADQAGCEARGCCWIPAKEKAKDVGNPLNTPYCFYPGNYESYRYLNVTETAFGVVAFLKRRYSSAYPLDVEVIKMTVKYETEHRLHVKITDPLQSRFEPPYPQVPIVDNAASNSSYQFYIDSTKSGFRVIRKLDNTVIFDSLDLPNMVFSNQFLQITTRLPSSNIYGIGEHRSRFKLSTDWTSFTLFNHDAIPTVNKNLYGSHPFYMAVESSGNSHGVFLLNSNAMDVILQPTPALTFRPIGGVLDFYFLMGPTPADVVAQYTDLIGRPYMPPYWGLGFHLCRFGYKTLNRTREVMQSNIDAGVPLDTQWNDIDYMTKSEDFTYDKVNFKGLPEFVNDLHSKGMHYIPMVDPGISGSEPRGTYPPFDVGVDMDIFVKNSTGDILYGKVWNEGTTVWPDFTNPNTVYYWTKMLKDYHALVAIDGAWIDMNEPSNFVSGSLTGCPKTELDNPPYLPGIDGGVINFKTMCMSAKHYAGLHYDIHNLYGFTEAIVTNFAFSEIRGKRPMVISRATFPGHGHYAGHWSGDVWSDWLDMRYTVPQLLDFSLFGIPLMGADICGFNGNTTQPLCNRWMQLGAFYPFSRNHNTDDGIDQDPFSMGEEVVASSKKALNVRYSLLPYLYTLFWRAHDRGDTVARPLFFEFPNDPKTLEIDDQFLWGPAFMIVPVLQENQTEVTPYIPAGVWYDFYSKAPIVSRGEAINMAAPLDTIPLLIRGGYILPQQAPEQTTTKSRLNKIDLLVAPDASGNGYGELYWDDGDSLNSYEEGRYSILEFSLESGVLRIQNGYWGLENPPNLGKVTVLGAYNPVSLVRVNNVTQSFHYDPINKYFVVERLDVSFKNPIVVTWT